MNNLDLDKIKKINNGQSKTVHYCNNPLPVGNIPVENCVKVPHNCSKPQTIVNQTALELTAIAGVLEKIIKYLQGLKSDTDLLSEFTESITKELTKTAQEETVQYSTERIIEKIGEVSLLEEILNQLAKESTLNESTASISQLFSTLLSKVSEGVEELRGDLSFVQQGVDDIKDNLNLKAAPFFIKDESGSTEVSFIIQPNYKYLFGERSTLTITLGEITNQDIVNHYMFEFTSGSTATTLSLPASIKWTTEPSIKPNKIYQVSIENNLGVIQEWECEEEV